MVIVAGTVLLNAETRDAALAAMNTVVAATRPENGCISYGFYADLNNPLSFQLYELWESQSALDAHMQQKHTQDFLAEVPAYLSAPPEVKLFQVSGGDNLL
jgi:quinol monooxygenase YgiN